MTRIEDVIEAEEHLILGEGEQKPLSPYEHLTQKPADFVGSFVILLVLAVVTLVVFFAVAGMLTLAGAAIAGS